MANMIDLLIALHNKQSQASRLERKIDESSEQFIVNMNDWHQLQDEIGILEQELRWARFIEYCNTPCWRYRRAL